MYKCVYNEAEVYAEIHYISCWSASTIHMPPINPNLSKQELK